ncbi:hypothetical protein ADUPG1_010898 [Aduncisulcus paluster]|uniref:Uncharacterized protein n=1 Tax=Aduncisulcus paluster TaxID=2918883 RepID=A0ABQ5JTK5_9EUKA|nr:hypothetical protein ADUPG1_010898 [Aduncisulcus paluster]
MEIDPVPFLRCKSLQSKDSEPFVFTSTGYVFGFRIFGYSDEIALSMFVEYLIRVKSSLIVYSIDLSGHIKVRIRKEFAEKPRKQGAKKRIKEQQKCLAQGRVVTFSVGSVNASVLSRSCTPQSIVDVPNVVYFGPDDELKGQRCFKYPLHFAIQSIPTKCKTCEDLHKVRGIYVSPPFPSSTIIQVAPDIDGHLYECIYSSVVWDRSITQFNHLGVSYFDNERRQIALIKQLKESTSMEDVVKLRSVFKSEASCDQPRAFIPNAIYSSPMDLRCVTLNVYDQGYPSCLMNPDQLIQFLLTFSSFLAPSPHRSQEYLNYSIPHISWGKLDTSKCRSALETMQILYSTTQDQLEDWMETVFKARSLEASDYVVFDGKLTDSGVFSMILPIINNSWCKETIQDVEQAGSWSVANLSFLSYYSPVNQLLLPFLIPFIGGPGFALVHTNRFSSLSLIEWIISASIMSDLHIPRFALTLSPISKDINPTYFHRSVRLCWLWNELLRLNSQRVEEVTIRQFNISHVPSSSSSSSSSSSLIETHCVDTKSVDELTIIHRDFFSILSDSTVTSINLHSSTFQPARELDIVEPSPPRHLKQPKSSISLCDLFCGLLSPPLLSVFSIYKVTFTKGSLSSLPNSDIVKIKREIATKPLTQITISNSVFEDYSDFVTLMSIFQACDTGLAMICVEMCYFPSNSPNTTCTSFCSTVSMPDVGDSSADDDACRIVDECIAKLVDSLPTTVNTIVLTGLPLQEKSLKSIGTFAHREGVNLFDISLTHSLSSLHIGDHVSDNLKGLVALFNSIKLVRQLDISGCGSFLQKAFSLLDETERQEIMKAMTVSLVAMKDLERFRAEACLITGAPECYFLTILGEAMKTGGFKRTYELFMRSYEDITLTREDGEKFLQCIMELMACEEQREISEENRRYFQLPKISERQEILEKYPELVELHLLF